MILERKQRSRLLSVFALLFLISCTSKRATIILDTDFGTAADDLGALAMLHNLMDKGECELLAVMAWSTAPFAVPAIDAVNSYYRHGDIPVGTRKGEAPTVDWDYSPLIAKHFSFARTRESVPAASTLYRDVLSNSKNAHVVIVVTGPLNNIHDLLMSNPDSISPLTGIELVREKVHEFVIMGGQFPEGDREWNFAGDTPGLTKNVIQLIPAPVTFVGYEVGQAIETGEALNTTDPNTPLFMGYKHFNAHAPWMKDGYQGKIQNSPSFDQAAVLYAVRGGTGQYWEKVYGTCIPDETGGNSWLESDSNPHAYLKLKMSGKALARRIERIMLGDI